MTSEYGVRRFAYYTREHTWARVIDAGAVKVGVTDYAQRKLGKILYVELPKVADEVKHMEPFGRIESDKAVSDLYSPLSGKVRHVNKTAIENPSLLNRDAYDAGWLIVIEPTNLQEEIKWLLDAETYKSSIRREN